MRLSYAVSCVPYIASRGGSDVAEQRGEDDLCFDTLSATDPHKDSGKKRQI